MSDGDAWTPMDWANWCISQKSLTNSCIWKNVKVRSGLSAVTVWSLKRTGYVSEIQAKPLTMGHAFLNRNRRYARNESAGEKKNNSIEQGCQSGWKAIITWRKTDERTFFVNIVFAWNSDRPYVGHGWFGGQPSKNIPCQVIWIVRGGFESIA